MQVKHFTESYFSHAYWKFPEINSDLRVCLLTRLEASVARWCDKETVIIRELYLLLPEHSLWSFLWLLLHIDHSSFKTLMEGLIVLQTY